MAQIQVAVLGLGRVGASIGLALKRYNNEPDAQHTFYVTGFATDPEAMKAAKALDCCHDYANQPYDAVRGKDIVVMAMPYADVEATYQSIATDLRTGVVVLDMSPLKEPSLAWARKHLTDKHHVIGATPLFNVKYIFDGVDVTARATADLFDDGLMLLSPSVSSVPEAIDLGSDLSGILGAKPQFIDSAEHDSLASATEGLPALIGLAYFYTLSQSRGWDDIQRMTNPAFAMLSHVLFDTHPDDLRDELLKNRETVVRFADMMLANLRELRDVVAEGDQGALEGVLGTASSDYEQWINRRNKQNWDANSRGPSVDAGNMMMKTMFGGFVANRIRRDKGDGEDGN